MLWTEYYHRLLVILTLLTQVCMDRLLHYSHIALSLFARLYRTLSSNSHICFCEIKCFGTRYTTCNILTSIDKNFSILSYIFSFLLHFYMQVFTESEDFSWAELNIIFHSPVSTSSIHRERSSVSKNLHMFWSYMSIVADSTLTSSPRLIHNPMHYILKKL